MDFFNSLSLDLKMLVVGIAGCVLLALFSGNHKSEKRYLIALAVLTAISVYRFTRPAPDEGARSASSGTAPVTTPAQPKPLASSSSR